MIATDLARPELENLPRGWFHHGPAILALLELHRPKVVVELGTWLGASAIAMARSVRRWGGTVTCVDTWAGELNDDGGSPPNRSPLMILSTARAMVDAGISAHVRLIPATTQAAAAAWVGPIDFLWVDADHSHDGVLADLRAWVPFVVPGGVIAGDDYEHPKYPGVKTAWDAFEAEARIPCTRYPPASAPNLGGLRLIVGEVPGNRHRNPPPPPGGDVGGLTRRSL